MCRPAFEPRVVRAVRGLVSMGLVLGLAFTMPWAVDDLAAQATGTVTGLVTNGVSGDAIAGAQISIPGTGVGTLANNVGRYVLLNVPAGTQIIRAEFIGFGTMMQEVNVPAGGSVVVDFALRNEAISLEGVVVTGTAGSARKREIGNSVAQINAAQIEAAPITEVADMLMGRATGVTVMQNSGQVGVGSTVRLRGNSSVSQGNNPLIYVDGVRIRNTGTIYQDEAGHSSGPLTDINPDDIERIEIIKGAAASTLYGTEAAGGVIQIFTKRGASGSAAWYMGLDYGLNNMGPIADPDIKNGLWLNDCTTPTPDGDPEDFGPTACPNGDWLDNGFIQKYNLSVRGGSEVSNYFLSGSWGDERGVIDQAGYTGDDEGQTSWSLRGNFGFNPRDDLTIRFNNAFIHKDVDWIADGDNAEGFLLNVMRAGAGYTPNNENGLIFGMKLKTLTDHFTTGVNVVYTPMEGMTHRFNGGLDWAQNDYQEEHPYEYWRVPLGNREVDQYVTRKLTFDYAGSWDMSLTQDFTSQTSWGGQLYDDFIFRLDAFGDDFAGPGDKEIDSAARTEANETRRNITNGGFFIQEMIGFRDKVFLTGGLRVDGHSSFGDDFGWAPYPKVSVSYVISDEAFWPETLGNMKLRSAFGESGKAPGVFDAVRTWDAVSGDDGKPGVTPDNLGNPELGPERTREFEVGLEGSVLDGRVTYEYTYYNQKTTDALIGVQQVPSGGFVGRQLENVGEIDNWGHELGVNVNALNRENLVWDLGLNFSTNNSEVVDLGGLESIYIGWRNEARPGQALPEFCHEVAINGNAIGEEPDMQDKCLGPTYPTHTYGINSSLTFLKRFTFDILGEGQGGHSLSAAVLYQNTRRYVNPLCWDIQEMVRNGNTANLKTSDWARCDRAYTSYGQWVQAADFFKIRSASLSYRIPEGWLPGQVRGATVRLQGRNLLKITDFQGLDPEVSEDGVDSLYRQGYYHLPPFRTFMLSMKVDF
jgi:TonB-linked SusC/RagA family outer membrane protein